MQENVKTVSFFKVFKAIEMYYNTIFKTEVEFEHTDTALSH